MRDRQGYLTLAAEIRQELESLERLARETTATWETRRSLPDDQRRAHVESVALKLHNVYTACERIFERVAGEVNGTLPRTPDWHLRLLRTMTVDVPEVRPRILSPAVAERLADYLRFRHLVRNVYGFELDESKMEGLVEGVQDVVEELRRELGGFLAWLEDLAREVGGR